MDTDEPIRIAQVIGKMWAGGVESVVFNYYRAMDHSKIQFDFFYDADSTVEPPLDLIKQGSKFYMLPPYQKIWRYIPSLRKYLKAGEYKIVHAHLNTLSIIPLFTAWMVGTPVRVAHNHSVPGGKDWKRNILKAILKKMSKIFATDYFACSEKAGRWLFGNKTYNNGKVLIVNNAIDFLKFCIPINDITELKKCLNIKAKLVVGHVGRFTYAKNHMKLLDIFSQIKMINPDSILLLVGDGELHEKISRKIEELRLENDVIFVGKVSNPQNYYPLMDILLLPSIFEGFSLAAIESQAAGVPVIASEVIPKIVCISDCCKFKSINESDKSWAIDAINLSKHRVKLSDAAENYDIYKCALKLQRWYLDHNG